MDNKIIKEDAIDAFRRQCIWNIEVEYNYSDMISTRKCALNRRCEHGLCSLIDIYASELEKILTEYKPKQVQP